MRRHVRPRCLSGHRDRCAPFPHPVGTVKRLGRTRTQDSRSDRLRNDWRANAVRTPTRRSEVAASQRLSGLQWSRHLVSEMQESRSAQRRRPRRSACTDAACSRSPASLTCSISKVAEPRDAFVDVDVLRCCLLSAIVRWGEFETSPTESAPVSA